MRKRIYMNKPLKLLMAIMLMFFMLSISGCKIASILLSDNENATIEADYYLEPDLSEKIFIYVSQPGWIDTPVSIRKEISDKMEAYIRTYFDDYYVPENIVTYKNYSDIEILATDFDPVKKAKELGATKMFYIEVLGLDVIRLSQLGYLSATMKIGALYYDVEEGKKIWPQDTKFTIIDYDIECEKGAEKLGQRLATSNAHCILRHFYDCKSTKYRIADESIKTDFDKW